MIVYRIAKSEKRALDLSGMGAYKEGGRWNNRGTYMLYCSENSSLAYLESLVHFDVENTPPDLYIMGIEIKAPENGIYILPDKVYPKTWQAIGNLENRKIGDGMMNDRKYIAAKVRSAINTLEYNYLLNPLFPGYHDLVKIISIERLEVDVRLIKTA